MDTAQPVISIRLPVARQIDFGRQGAPGRRRQGGARGNYRRQGAPGRARGRQATAPGGARGRAKKMAPGGARARQGAPEAQTFFRWAIYLNTGEDDAGFLAASHRPAPPPMRMMKQIPRRPTGRVTNRKYLKWRQGAPGERRQGAPGRFAAPGGRQGGARGRRQGGARGHFAPNPPGIGVLGKRPLRS